MKQKTLWVAIALMMAACSSNGDDEESPKSQGITMTRGEQELVASNNAFAFNLMRKVADTEKSVVLSPISITYALGMLNNGATGETRQQINNVLGFADAGAVNDFCKKMLAQAPALDPRTKVMIANNIYMNKGYDLKPAFVQTVGDYYNAHPETLDFYSGQAMDIINQWASDHTQQMIDKVLDQDTFDPSAVSYLLNAIYFKGEWSHKFKKENTHDEPFNGGAKVPMMHQTRTFPYQDTDDYQALRLPFGNSAYAMTILLPHEGKSIGDVLSTLTAEQWQRLGTMYSEKVDVKLPRFESKTDQDLIEVMSELGMPRLFTLDAELPGFCSEPTYIGMMKQVARIKVNEEGAEAAVVTIGAGYVTAAPAFAVFHATRPFLYFISEQSTGAIFFMGQYMGD